MKIALIGLSNSGKTTVFNALTGQNLETTLYPTVSGDPHFGVIKVPDPRLDKLSEIFKPKKTTHATIEYIDYIGLTKGDHDQNRKVFDLIKDVDAIVHVVRTFHDETITHPLNAVDPRRDIEITELELILGDLELVEKRIERMNETVKQGKNPDELEKALMLKCRDYLTIGKALRTADFTSEELDIMKSFQFLTTKPEVVVFNISETELEDDKIRSIQTDLEALFPSLVILSLCGKLEMELSRLDPSDAGMFLDDLGIDEPASSRLIRVCHRMLGLITFFTTRGNEARAWSIKRGTPALKAAGKVHSDIERGFIRAEVISFEDFIAAGSMHAAREKGQLRLEGKTYEVNDGDIISFRFNV
jgi:GTP-binding protein YchF